MSPPKGAEHFNARLTTDQALAIILDPRPLRAIAREYKISVPHVCNIRRRRRWLHLPSDGFRALTKAQERAVREEVTRLAVTFGVSLRTVSKIIRA